MLETWLMTEVIQLKKKLLLFKYIWFFTHVYESSLGFLLFSSNVVCLKLPI